MAGLTYDGIPSTQTDSSNFSGTNFLGVTGSFTNVTLGGSVIAGRLSDGNGTLFSANVGSPATYGAIVQGGIVGPFTNGSLNITFGRNFADANYGISVIALGSLAVLPYVFSGTSLHTTSGTWVGGQSGTNAIYGYVAVGV